MPAASRAARWLAPCACASETKPSWACLPKSADALPANLRDIRRERQNTQIRSTKTAIEPIAMSTSTATIASANGPIFWKISIRLKLIVRLLESRGSSTANLECHVDHAAHCHRLAVEDGGAVAPGARGRDGGAREGLLAAHQLHR